MKTILPYLRLKKAQAGLGIEFQEYMRETDIRGRTKGGAYRKIGDDVMKKREGYKNRMSRLNGR